MTETNYKPVPFPTGDKQYLKKFKLHKEGKDHHLYDTGKAGEIAFGVKLFRNPDTNKKSMPCFSYCANKGGYEKKNLWTKEFHKDNPKYKGKPLFKRSGLLQTQKPIIMVEGEVKCNTAQKLYANHFVTTYQGGRSGWGDHELKKYHTDFSDLRGRDVTLWPDIDQDGEGKVQFEKLCRVLIDDFKVNAKIVNLPEFDEVCSLYKEEYQEDFTKTSYDLDDLLISHWSENLDEMILDTYVPDPSVLVEIPYSNIAKDINNLVFIDNATSPVYYDITKNKLTSGANINEKYQRDSKNLKNKKDATKYLNKHNCAIVDALAFKPGADKIYKGYGKFEGQTLLNKYQRPSFPRIDESIKYEDELAVPQQHIKDILCGGSDLEWNRFENIFASDFRHPERNRKYMVVLKSSKGVGKSWLWNVLSECYGARNCQPIDFKQLTGQYQGCLTESCYLFIDEVESRGFEDKDRRANLKRLVSESYHTIDMKMINHFTINCFYTIWGSTNEEIPLKIDEDPEEERRLYYLEIPYDKKYIFDKYGEDYFKKLFGFFDPDVRSHQMMRNIHLFYDYYRYRFKADPLFDITTAPLTEAKVRLAKLNRPAYYNYLDEIIAQRKVPATRKDFVNQNEFMEEVIDYAHEDKLSPIARNQWKPNMFEIYFKKNKKHFSLPEAVRGFDRDNPNRKLRGQCIRNHEQWKALQYNYPVIEAHLVDNSVDTSKLQQFVEQQEQNKEATNDR